MTKFRKMRTEDPRGSEAPLSKVHRSDVFKLDGRDGQRAATWHDTERGVVWLLGFTSEHDFGLLEKRAVRPETRDLGGTSQLMPSNRDYEDLEDERRSADVYQLVAEALASLYESALKATGVVQRGTLAHTVRCEVLVPADDDMWVHLRFRTPPLKRGVLGKYFEYVLAATLPGADESSVTGDAFPDGNPAVADALTVSVLVDR